MKMRVDSTSRTLGGRVSQAFQAAGLNWLAGADYQHNQRNAERFAGMPIATSLTNLQTRLWPDASLQQPGIFLEADKNLSNGADLSAGIRYDQVSASADAAERAVMGGATAGGLYRQYYADARTEQTEHNIAGFLHYLHPLNAHTEISASLSRSLRTAAMQRWIGNPALKPEQHHQLELGLNWEQTPLRTSASVFYNRVTDYILRDRARAQAGILQNDGATIYRNVDADFYGFEWALTWHLSAQLDAAYVHANNRDTDRPLAQIPPLEGSAAIEYRASHWLLGSRLRFAADQTRVDADAKIGSGQDAGATAGFGVLDLYGRYQMRQIEFSAGVENLFDRLYAYHLNRANADPFNPEAVRVNEPGRSL